ncbi:PPP4R2, putative [Babesia ovis]|uniref:PPP4R2, putative n=1 Tax=Babesia ovis TaxID=5869 RepID=A0A9W5TB26_BABOV|nr:PPP4R2, putative [Babesia ovis]
MDCNDLLDLQQSPENNPPSGHQDEPSTLVKAVRRDEVFTKLQKDLKSEMESENPQERPIYRKVVHKTIEVLSEVDATDSPVELSPECVLMLEDIAANGTCYYPWPVAQLLLLVVWSRLFDQLYQQECDDAAMDPVDYAEERRALLALLVKFDHEPLSLQRLSEIPIKQPYQKLAKLMHAYRKIILIRPMLPEETLNARTISCPTEALDADMLQKASAAIESWSQALDNPLKHAWDEDAWMGLWDPDESTADLGPTKRPLETDEQ